jgi:hypothetical protein
VHEDDLFFAFLLSWECFFCALLRKYANCVLFLTHGMRVQVEAKRAVPRSEVSRDTGGPPKLGVAVKPAGGSAAGSSNPPGSGLASPSQTQIQNESRHALDARINMDEYAYNKIFVGGLHYDTRDGKIMA